MLSPLEITAIVLLCIIGSCILTALLSLICLKITESSKWNFNYTCTCGPFSGVVCMVFIIVSLGLSLGLTLGSNLR